MRMLKQTGFMFPNFALISLLLGLTTHAFGEPAKLSGSGQAQAFTFSHQGQCYAITPNHVTSRSSFSLIAGNPERLGQGTLTPLRFPDSDLALAVVKGPLAATCEPSWTELPRNLGRLLPVGGDGVLVTVRGSGLTHRVAVRMSPVSYEHIGITPTDSSLSDSIGKGRSGSLLVVRGQPAGILINLPKDAKLFGAQARVLRMDAIVARLDRYISGRKTLASASNSSGSTQSAGEVSFSIEKWNVQPISSENSALNLDAENALPYITAPLRKPLELDAKLEGTSALEVNEIILTTDTEQGRYTAPKRITVLASNLPNAGRERIIGSGEMSPDGHFKLRLAATRMRWILIRVSSVWDEAKPLRIDQLIVR